MTPYKNRTINYLKPVRVYRNLHRGGYSIQQNGVIVAHASRVVLGAVRCVVSEAGRQRVLKERVKNVHAFLDGTLMRHDPLFLTRGILTYNPYRYATFVDKQTEQPVEGCTYAILDDKAVYYG